MDALVPEGLDCVPGLGACAQLKAGRLGFQRATLVHQAEPQFAADCIYT
jgi:hypothetical protein